jgi:thymidylate kinase
VEVPVEVSGEALVDRLVKALNQLETNYCHWKSNFYLKQNVSEDDDIDLLIDRKSLLSVQSTLLELGFKQATIQWGANPPGIYHYYGFDTTTGLLVHLHLYTIVLTGESFIKSHLLPFEQMLLEDNDTIGSIKVPSRSAELVLFMIRNYIKYGSLLDVIYLQKNPDALKNELIWLQSGADLAEALAYLQKYCPVIDQTLFMRCIRALNEPTSLYHKVLLAFQVRRRLRGYAKNNRLAQNLAYVEMLWQYGLRRLAGNRRNKVLNSGGAVIAFVGPEATGKSTLVNESRRWLGRALTTRSIHAGKPPTTWLTAPINILLPFARNLAPQLRMSRRTGHVATTSLKALPPQQTHTETHTQIHKETEKESSTSLFYALRAVALAWDRRALLLRARRASAHGEIVICDRYPSENIGAMDSPRLRQDNAKSGVIPAIYRWLAQLEQRLYQQIPPPDAVLRLNVSIETAKKRNSERIKAGKEDNSYVESRHRESKEWRRSGTKYLYNIDTELSLAETIQQVKKAIWELL